MSQKTFTITYSHIGTDCKIETGDINKLFQLLERAIDDPYTNTHTISINTIEAPVATLPPDMRVTDGNKFKSGIAPLKR